ncbi:MAG: hypothetical protein Q9180_008715 [Flavoplaca navasiana]
MSEITAWFAKLPRNAQASVQRLTFYGWLRLILIVSVYIFLIRPFLMKLAEKSQTAAYEKAAKTSAAGPNVLRGHAKAREDEAAAEDTETSETSGRSWGPEARKRQTPVVDEEIERELMQDDQDAEDADVEFLKKYCT